MYLAEFDDLYPAIDGPEHGMVPRIVYIVWISASPEQCLGAFQVSAVQCHHQRRVPLYTKRSNRIPSLTRAQASCSRATRGSTLDKMTKLIDKSVILRYTYVYVYFELVCVFRTSLDLSTP